MDKKIIKYTTEKATETEDERVLRFIGSDSSVDRDGDIVDVNGWDLKAYKKNPVVLFGHRASETPVARTKNVWVENDKLMFDIEFPEASVSAIGDSLYKLYKGGFMKATSVGFIPDYNKIEYPKDNKGARRILKKNELLEISLVSVPANPRALLTNKSIDEAVKLDVIDNKELKQLSDWLDTFIEPETKSEPVETKPDESAKVIKSLQDQITELKEEIDGLKSKSYLHQLYNDFNTKDKNDVEDVWSEWIRELS